MNSTATNVGGWPATAMYKYLNGDTNDHLTYNDSDNGTTATLYSKLPSDLQSIIIDTTAISGHGSTSGETNFTSIDKIYLLSSAEVWANGVSYDTAKDSTITRQLDFYSTNKVTTSNYSVAVKKYNGTAVWWWLRAATSYSTYGFLSVSSNGYLDYYYANGTNGGLAPAFRIG